MAKRHVSSKLERAAMVFYPPAVRAFWIGPKSPPGRLRQARVYDGRVSVPPTGGVAMRVRRARQMLSANAHARYLQFMQEEDREFLACCDAAR